MKYEQRGILTLMLVSTIALTMLLAFGVRAIDTASQCEVSPVQCKYSQVILTANRGPLSP